MPEIDNVQIGETIAVEWGNAIRDRTVQRYADAAERAELHPNPTEGDLSYLEDTNSIEVFDGFAWVAGIPNQAVTQAKIAPGAVTASRIADQAVTEAKIASNAVTQGKLAPEAVTFSRIADGAVITSKIADQAVTEAKIASNAVTQGKLAPEAVTFSRIADGAVITSKIADGAVTQAKIASNAVDQAKLAPGAVTFSRIAGDAIAAFERSGATTATSVNLPASVGNLVTVTLNIPSSWSSWECVAFAHATARPSDSHGDIALIVRIDGTDGSGFDYHVPHVGPTGNTAYPVAVTAASFRSGITTTGNRTIALRGLRKAGSADVVLQTVFLYARAFRTS